MNTTSIVLNAANNPEFLEDIRNFSSEEIFGLFIENTNKEEFLQKNPLSIKKYIRVFLHGYNYEVDFEKLYGEMFFVSTNSVLQKGIISIFLISSNYNQSQYHTYLSSLGHEQLDAILSYFHTYINPMTIIDGGINTILEQLRTRKQYLKLGLTFVK